VGESFEAKEPNATETYKHLCVVGAQVDLEYIGNSL
jgi:hypothetical protein